MSVIFVMIPMALLLGGAAVLAFALAAKRGQFDDLDTPPLRMVIDDAQDTRRTP
jgi:cbb3-type cytochrome oxidase maturation protein